MIDIVENFLELVEIDSIVEINEYQNSVDLTIEDDASFILSNGIVSHNSALGSFREFRDVMTQGAFPLRGKFLNVTGMSNVDVIQNKEVKELLIATGLKMGEPPENMRYGKILIYADADPDGDCIAGLLMNFFGRYWPELFGRGAICRVMTPLVVAKKGNEKKCFYTQSDFDKWIDESKDIKKWSIEYKKGLASLEQEDFKDIIQNPQTFAISPGENLKVTLDTWFAEDPSARKEKILTSDVSEVVDDKK